VKPTRTPAAVLNRLAARIEEIGEERHRRRLAEMFPAPPACPHHGWSPPGPGLIDATALSSLCPGCREERRRAQREAEAPEVVTLEVRLPPAIDKAWRESLLQCERAGHVLPGSTIEREALQVIDEGRREETALLQETPEDRRRGNATYWRRRMSGVHTRAAQTYEPHPARAGR
jgi:hypothetical protein